MTIRMDDRRRQDLTAQLQRFVREQFDESMSDFRAGQVIDFFLAALGPHVYNQAVQDARKFMQQKLEDLDGEVYEPDAT